MASFDFATNMGANPNSAALIRDIATDLGFRVIKPYEGLQDAERQAKTSTLNFFLFDYSAEFSESVKKINQLRSSKNLKVRFAPLICLVESPSKEAFVKCVNAGFDDILTLPWSATKIGERLAAQVDSTSIYFETNSYLGPDRRKYFLDEKVQIQAAPGLSHGFRRFEFSRNPHTGVHITSDRVIGRAPQRLGEANSGAVQHRMAI